MECIGGSWVGGVHGRIIGMWGAWEDHWYVG